MKFCEVCDNLLYIKLAGGVLTNQCNYCGCAYPVEATGEPVLDTDYRDDRAKYHHLLTELLHDDPTLPRVDNVPCPNEACSRPARAKGNVLYVKYDPVNLRFLYSCGYCKAFWGPEELKVFIPSKRG
jgi:DNA-directed RNA polymerase subunit M/transcription elongation factor TFIIS